MFWESVLGGFVVLSHWEVWLSLLIYVALNFAWLLAIGALMGDNGSVARKVVGFLIHFIGGSAFQAILLGVLVLALTPVMIGGDDVMPVSFFTTFAKPIAVGCILAFVIVLFVGFVPIIGQLVTEIPGLDDFIQGIIIFRFFSAAFIESSLNASGLEVSSLYPGFWAITGYFLLSLVLVFVSTIAVNVVGEKLMGERFGSEGDTSSFLLAGATVSIASLLPLFMYGSHVGLAIQGKGWRWVGFG